MQLISHRRYLSPVQFHPSKSNYGDKSEVPNKSKKAAIKQQLENMSASSMQLNIFESNDPALVKLKEILEELDLNGMTPIECMMKLSELKGML